MIQAIPNISEGRRENVVRAVVDAIESVSPIRLLDHSSDPSHHRSVITLAGDANAIREAVLQLFAVAIQHIDLRKHDGKHPRLGAIDVLPLVPLGDTPMESCIDLARKIGAGVAESFNVPVFLYEAAASAPHRRHLEQIRRGGFESLRLKLLEDAWKPDYGPTHPHPSAGASIIGARGPLIAFNVNLSSHDLDIARHIARRIRASGGGLPAVKALGVRVSHAGHHGVQVSINLTDYRRTPLAHVITTVAREAATRGTRVAGIELVGLIPADAVTGNTSDTTVRNFIRPDQILEARLARCETRRGRASSGTP